MDIIGKPVLFMCNRCNYVWASRKSPTRCANVTCRSPYWNKPRRTLRENKSAKSSDGRKEIQ